MAYRPTPFGIELAARYEKVDNARQAAVSVFHVAAPGPLPTPVPHAQLQDALDFFRVGVVNHFLPVISNQGHLVRATARDISQEGGEVVEDVTISAGGHVGAALPLRDAIVITWRTAKTGRSYRGRTYMPFVPDDYHSNVDPNTITDAAVALYRTAAEDFRAYMDGAGHRLQVKSGQHNKVLLDPQILTPVTSRTVDNKIDHQDRRGRIA